MLLQKICVCGSAVDTWQKKGYVVLQLTPGMLCNSLLPTFSNNHSKSANPLYISVQSQKLVILILKNDRKTGWHTAATSAGALVFI